MKKINILTATYSLCVVSCTLYTKEPQTINNNNIHIYTSATQASSSTNVLSAVQQLPLTPAMLEKLGKQSGSFLNKNKLLLAAIASAYLYGRTFVAVVQGNHELANTTSWASWKSDVSLDELKALDQAVLTKELLRDIQKRHTSAEKPADALLPFITFLSTIDTEIDQINRYRSLHFWIETCHASWLFPLNERRFASASNRLERLWFVKNLFLSWAADYKLSNLTNRTPKTLGARLYRYLVEKLCALLPESAPLDTLTPAERLEQEQKRMRTRTLLTTLAEAACIAPLAVALNQCLPAQHRIFINNNTVSVHL